MEKEIIDVILELLNNAVFLFKKQEQAEVVTIDFLRERRKRILDIKSEKGIIFDNDQAIAISLLSDVVDYCDNHLSEDEKQKLFNFIVDKIILKQ